jgi:hypothetical protein
MQLVAQNGVATGGEGGIRTHGRVAPTPDFEWGMRYWHYAVTRMDIGSMDKHTVHGIRCLHTFGQIIPMRETMKNLTFAIGLSWLIYGALFFGYPDWDIGVSLVMAFSTYFCADFVWQRLGVYFNHLKHWRHLLPENKARLVWRLALVALFTWWCVDGSYTVYWSLVNPSVMIREGQWPMSLCLFLLCGFVWTAAPTLDRFRDNLQSIDRDLKASRLPQLARVSSLCLQAVVALQRSTVARRLLG